MLLCTPKTMLLYYYWNHWIQNNKDKNFEKCFFFLFFLFQIEGGKILKFKAPLLYLKIIFLKKWQRMWHYMNSAKDLYHYKFFVLEWEKQSKWSGAWGFNQKKKFPIQFLYRFYFSQKINYINSTKFLSIFILRFNSTKYTSSKKYTSKRSHHFPTNQKKLANQ